MDDPLEKKRFCDEFSCNLYFYLYSDVLFKLEDGTCSAHKPILMARSDMMCAMFTHEEIFKEASARVIHFPGVNKLTFYQVLKTGP